MARSSLDVIQHLLDEMSRIVKNYPPSVTKTGKIFDELAVQARMIRNQLATAASAARA